MDLATIHMCIQGSTWLYETFQMEGLWFQFLLIHGLVRPVPENSLVLFPTDNHPNIDWIRLAQLHQQMNSGLFVWVRIQRTDVRVPLPLVATYSANVLLFELNRLFRREAGPVRPFRRKHLRLRLLQCGGHPGILVQDRAVQAGGLFLLELALPEGKGWPLPPTELFREPSASPSALMTPCGRQWQSLIRFGDFSAPVPQPDMELDVRAVDSSEQSTLLRVVSLLLPRAVWVSVKSDGSLGDMYQCVLEGIVRESPLLAELSLPLQVQLMDARDPTSPAGVPSTSPLRDIFWTQCETVRVELDIRGGSRALSLLIWRGRAFQEIPYALAPLSQDFPARFRPHVLADLQPLCSRFVEINDHLPEPSIQKGGTDGDADMNRQAIPVLLPGRGPSSWENHGPKLAPPGRMWPRRRAPPRVLPKTVRARQFEFHPSLPDVMLTGDLYGCVNVITDTEMEDMHPALCVGQNPLLALVWMKHHPQHAISGVAHSGEIVFLRYDPFTAMSEPTMQIIHSAENFPQLSCLSVNTTDDFMLASGLPPDFAVYDVSTGKVLKRASGCHTDTINTASFSNTSPHVFVTASFDNTCKIWDLRQPLFGEKAVKTLCTGGRNIMCTFSPDDRHVQCSGVDTQLVQFEVPSWRRTPEHFDLRQPMFEDRFRRSCYLPDGCRLATAATEEASVHVMSVWDGSIVEAMDFQGLRYQRPWARELQESEWESGRSTPRIFPEAAEGEELLEAGIGGTSPGGAGRGRRDRNSAVFVQSLRAHPDASLGRLGVLLRPQRGKRSCVVLMDGVQ
jgi:hypothetical protein